MRIAYKCPHCNYKESISISYIVMVLCCLSIIGMIPWMIWYLHRIKCPKCKTIMQNVVNINSK